MRALAILWGVGGIVLLLVSALGRLVPMAGEAIASGLGALEWSALGLNVAGMAWFEGYRGFQRNFSPRVAARARHLADHPTTTRALLAPIFCMGFFAAPPRRRAGAIGLTLGIATLVIAVRQLAQPWRGIVDAGVVVGLAWGVVTLLVFTARAFGRGLARPPEVE